MIATNVRRLSLYLLLAFAVVSGSLVWWQVLEAPSLATRGDNPEVIAARRSLLRGTIFDASGQVLATSQLVDGISTRTYTDPAFTHVIGYASFRFGSTGIESAFEDLLVGQADPNPFRDLVNDVLDRQPQPRDLTLTIDRRLQDFAQEQLGGNPGAVVAIDPATGAIRAMVSSPTFDANPISGNPDTAQPAMDALREDPAEPLLARARQGQYIPGSIMKVVTAVAALESGVITPDTTFPDQPRQETEGFVVDGFTIREHDLAGIHPALWPLSPALQVSSNIFFAHVGLELGAERFLDAARRLGFCEPLEIGPPTRALNVAPSYLTSAVEGDCGPFSGDVELASAAFGQGSTFVTPVQMALVAAAVAADGVMPHPYVVRDVRAHAEGSSPSETVLDTLSSGGGTRVMSGETASQVRSAMLDAVNGDLGRLFAGEADITLYGISQHRAAGKTGTAQLGGEQAPHSWFIGFAPAEGGATPEIAVAVLVQSGGSGATGAAPIAGRVMAEWLRLSAEGG